MELLEFKRKNKLSYRELSELIGSDNATIARLFCIPKQPKNRMMQCEKYMHTILTATNGAVTTSNFYAVQNCKIILN